MKFIKKAVGVVKDVYLIFPSKVLVGKI